MHSVPLRPQSNARIERFIQELEKGTAAAMDHARAPYPLWSYAVRHWCFNRARRPRPGKTMSPYEMTYERPPPETLFPFACRVTYKDPEHLKFGNRHREAIALCYGPQESVVCLDAEEFFEEGKAKVVTTPDVQLFPSEFPFREKEYAAASLGKFTEAFTRHYNTRMNCQGEEYNKHGQPICILCKKLKLTTPITCKACLQGTPHPKGCPGPGCRRARCQGHDVFGDQSDPPPASVEEEKDDDEEQKMDLSRSPHVRMT